MRSITRMFAVALLAAAVVALALPAFAHVTVRVDNPAPEAFAKYIVRVPNESEGAATTKIEVELPEEFAEARVQPLEGWNIAVEDGVLVIEGGRIEPGQFQEFAFSARNPAEEGDLVLPSIQTYDDGEVVRWTGDPDADQPAPVVVIAGQAAGHGSSDGETESAGGHGAGGASEPAARADDVESDVADSDEEAAEADTTPTAATGSTDTLTIVALIAGVLGMLLGAAALLRRRP